MIEKRKVRTWKEAREYIAELEKEVEKLQKKLAEQENQYLEGWFSFLGGLYRIRRIGQLPPQKSDDVQVEAEILLPTNENGMLREDIRFGYRLILADQALTSVWGKNVHGRFRSRSQQFSAPTWREAFREAKEWIDSEQEKLNTALLKRAQALENAEL